MSSCTTGTGNVWALSRGNDLPVDVSVSSRRGEDVSGLTFGGYIAEREGGAEITTPATAFVLTEGADSTATLGAYRAVVDAPIVNALIDMGAPGFWVAWTIPGDLLIWRYAPVVEHRTLR